MSNIDWSDIEKAADITPEETKRRGSLSNKKCVCGKEMTNGENEAHGICTDCYIQCIMNGEEYNENYQV